MSVEGNQEDVEKLSPDAQGVVKVKPDAAGKYPEVVPWQKYVAIKESLGGKLDAERAKVSSLEERLKSAVSPDEFNRIKGELETTKAKLTETTTELTTTKEKTLSEKRSTLISRGVPEEKAKAMSEKEIDGAFVVLQHTKPGPDMGSGGNSGSPLTGSPMELAKQAYTKK